jgi:hypothetical protein
VKTSDSGQTKVQVGQHNRLSIGDLDISDPMGPRQALEEAARMIGGPEGVAAKLRAKRSTLLSKMKKLGIFRPLQERRLRAPVEALQQAESSAAV